jgi:hypothetical protein
MPQIVTAIDIDAPPSVVWDVLVDSDRYAEWNPMLRLLRGRLRKGAIIIARLDADGLPMVFDARITRYEPGRLLAWQGPSLKLLHPVVSGEHSFELVDLGDGRTRFVHSERFDGILLHVEALWAKVEKRLRIAYPKFDEALKRRSELTRAAA